LAWKVFQSLEVMTMKEARGMSESSAESEAEKGEGRTHRAPLA